MKNPARPRLRRHFVFVLAIFCLDGVHQAAAQDLPAPTQNAVAGAAVFGEKGCIRCHSVNDGVSSIGPDLRSIESGRSFQSLTAALWNHLPGMSRRMADLGIGAPHLSEREAGDLFAFLYTLGYFDSAGDPERGGQLFTEKSCIRCHQVRGVGGVIGPVLDHIGARGVPIEVAAAMWNHGPSMIEASETRGISRPSLTGRDLTDLIAFLQSDTPGTPVENLYVLPGDAEAGARVIEEHRCAVCHGAPGGGGGIAPDLAGLRRGASLIDFVALMWNQTPAMVAALRARDLEFPHLEPQDFANIVAYLYSVNYFAAGGQATRGPALIREKGCESCHSTARLSSIPGLGHPASITAALWNHLAVLQTTEELEAWPSFTAREMGDLMAFFLASSP